MRATLLLIFGLFLITSCNKDDDQEVGDTPVITFESISPGTAKAYSDSVVIRVQYEDGNGDLGENNTTESNAFVTDTRSGLEYQFRIRQLAPNDANIHIRGSLNIVVPQVAFIGSGSSETATFKVKIEDRAGNMSNEITTTAITVTP
jgi:hypothetical protein